MIQDNGNTLDKALHILERSDAPGKKTDEENWNEFQFLVNKKEKKKIVFYVSRIAAVFLVALFAGGIVVYQGERTISCEPASLVQHKLPDGSTVDLNAGTKIKYNSVLWSLTRELNLTGEAYFKVKKGKRFSVISSQGITQVLGTTFTVYARDETYRVSCFTGKVMVSVDNRADTKLVPGNQLQVVDTNLNLFEIKDSKMVNAWLEKGFYFKETKLEDVFLELGRRYDYSIVGDYPTKALYSGFYKEYKLDELLRIISLPFNLEYEIDTLKREIRIHEKKEQNL